MNTKAALSSEAELAPRALKDLPGPKPLPLVGNTLQVSLPRLHLDMEGWIQQYGSMVKAHFGPMTFMVVGDHEVISTLLRDRPDGFRRPSRLYEVVVEMGMKPGVFSAEGAAWQNQRRMVMASFAPGHVRSYFPSLLKVTQRLHARWVRVADSGTPIDLQADLMRFTVDAISGLAFGRDINTLESKEEVIQSHLDKVFPALYKRVNTLIPYWRYIKLPKDRALDHSIGVINENIKMFIGDARARLASDPARRLKPENLLEAMIVAADVPESGVNDDDVVGNVFTLLLGGEDTTATSISWMIYLLSRNPVALEKAQAEVRTQMGNLASYTPEALGNLDYLEACAHEAMRIKPVGPLNVVEALHDCVVGDVRVPKGTTIMCVMRHDAMNERYFHQARQFKPERWLDSGESSDTTGAAGAPTASAFNAKRISMPFGAGARVCPGRYLALLEIKLAMAMLLNEFDIVSVDTPDGQEVQELMSFSMVPVGLTMKIRNRAR